VSKETSGATARNDAVAVTTRSKTGTTSSKALRHAGNIPATLSGHGAAPLSISIDAKRFDELLHAGARHHLLHVTIDGSTNDTAMIRDVERDPLTKRIIHADLQRVSAREAIEATINVVTAGTPVGHAIGGVLEIVTHELSVRGPADSMPQSLHIDVSKLNVHETIHASDVTLPEGFSLVSPPETVVVTVGAARTMTETEGEAAPAAAPAAPAASEGAAS
jgi:large subunit ribosomal protein L25